MRISLGWILLLGAAEVAKTPEGRKTLETQCGACHGAQLPEIGPGTTRGGVLSTAGGITFFCADGREFGAVDSPTGKLLRRFSGKSLLAGIR